MGWFDKYNTWEDSGNFYKYGDQSVLKSDFNDLNVADRMAYEDLGKSSGMFAGFGDTLKDTGLLNSTSKGANGEIITNQGMISPAIGAFQAWNAWNQGNKMYDLQSEAFDFSKDKFWNNMAMKLDDRERYLQDRKGANDVLSAGGNGGAVSQSQRDNIITNAENTKFDSPVSMPDGYGSITGGRETPVANSGFYQDPNTQTAAKNSVVGSNPSGYGSSNFANNAIIGANKPVNKNTTPPSGAAAAQPAKQTTTRPLIKTRR